MLIDLCIVSKELWKSAEFKNRSKLKNHLPAVPDIEMQRPFVSRGTLHQYGVANNF